MARQVPAIAWAVVIRGYPGTEGDEVAAVFAARRDAAAHADWWNRGEIARHGADSTVSARVEEIDFYPPGTWQPPPIGLQRGGRQSGALPR